MSIYDDTWFDEKVASRLERDETGCLNWTGATNDKGYGLVHTSGIGSRLVHRVAYEHLVGPIPDGLQIDHLCRNRACANVEHLEPVTNRLNILRGATIAADHASRTHCHRGHELAGANLVASGLKRGLRQCRTCLGIRNRLREEAVRAARKALGYTYQRYIDEFGRSAAVAIEIMRRLEAEEPLDGVQDAAPGSGWHGKRTIAVVPNTSLTEEDLPGVAGGAL